MTFWDDFFGSPVCDPSGNIMLRRLPNIIRAMDAATDPDDVLNALHDSVAPAINLCAIWPMASADEVITFRDVFYHHSIPASFRDAARSRMVQHGLSPMAQLALLDPLPFTFSEAKQLIQPRGADHWVFDFLQEHGMRDGLYCPRGNWIVLFWADRVLKRNSALARETRMMLDAAAGIAVYRLKEMITKSKLPDQPRLSPRELVVLRHLSHGEDAATIGRLLALSETSVRTYLKRAQKKLKAQNQPHAIAIAMRKRLI
ncbi:MAG: autoinducer binding domain-containing protein [Bradyrhizobium sp.]|jgi:DNA-binding CsgD family transcriptional regulator|nr:autoinducer binding domain-containing protein [Bradyrhizobium sp.]